MPVEIRELIITARVEDRAGARHGSSSPVKMQGLSERELQRIVTLCAEQVMDILNRQKER